MAAAGTIGHVVVPYDGDLVHVRFTSNLGVEEC